MAQSIYNCLNLFLMAIRPFISLFLLLISIGIRPLRQRFLFERKNKLEEGSTSFREEALVANVCFEISSEGELEQVRPLMFEALKKGERIEILFSSPSVEKKIVNIYADYPEQVRYLRLPLVSFCYFDFLYFQSPWIWMSAKKIIFCRYDFFPELMILKNFGYEFILISGAFKKMSTLKKWAFAQFDMVVAATDLERENFLNFFREIKKEDRFVFSCDLRIPRIDERFKHAESTLNKNPQFQRVITAFKQFSDHQKIIIGSAWESDLAIFDNPDLIEKVKAAKLKILIAPHKLQPEFVQKIKNKIDTFFGEENCIVLREDDSLYIDQSVVVFATGGILCELYSAFKVSYVGGGYERSIHSVLEPYMAHCAVICGPKIYRSTEYDLVFEMTPNEIVVLNNPNSFYNSFKSLAAMNLDYNLREKKKADINESMRHIFKKILG